MFSTDAKILLNNVIRHAKTHNRLLEEADMWKQWEEHNKGRHSPVETSPEYRTRHSSVETSPEHRTRHSAVQRWPEDCVRHSSLRGSPKCINGQRLVPGPNYLSRARMDWHCGSRETTSEGEDTSTYWRRQLLKAEETDPDRWGHNGFKELYEDFDSNKSSCSDENKRKDVEGGKKKGKTRSKHHTKKSHHRQKSKSSNQDRHHCRNSDGDVSQQEETHHRKRARTHQKCSTKYMWVEKPVVITSDEPESMNRVKCSSRHVDDRQCNSVKDSENTDKPIKYASVTIKHSSKVHSSSHICHPKKNKSDHKKRHHKQDVIS